MGNEQLRRFGLDNLKADVRAKAAEGWKPAGPIKMRWIMNMETNEYDVEYYCVMKPPR